MRKSNPILTYLLFLFLFFSVPYLTAQNIVRDTIYATTNEEIVLRGLSKLISCPCSGGICEPIEQPGGNWSSNEGIICRPCFDITIRATTTTLYQHRTPSYSCPPPPPSSGPLPPAGPTNPELIKETLVIVPDCNNYTGTMFFETCDDGFLYFLIRLPDGRVLDPYFAEGVENIIADGISVDFDYVPADFATTCNLASEAVTITCIRETPPEPCSTNEGTIFFEQCDDEGFYFFIRFDDGRVIDPYFAEEIDHPIVDGQRVEFDYVTADFETPCSIAEAAVTITCIREAALPYTETDNCVCDICGVENPNDLPWVNSVLSGPFDRGLNVFYNETTESIVFGQQPIAPDVGLSFYDCSGQIICQTSGFDGPPGFCSFDFNDLTLIGRFEKPNTANLCGDDGQMYTSYCDAECAGVTITSDRGCPPPTENNDQIFIDYPWLTNLVNTADCDGTTIKEYDLGSYSFVLVQSSTSTILYYQDGMMYCQSSSNYDCVSLYNLDDSQVMSEFICGAGTDGGNGGGTNFDDFPWLDAVIADRCCGDNEVILYEVGIFSYIFITGSVGCNGEHGRLYFEDGTPYCSDAASYDCRSAYNLSGGTLLWSCDGGSIQSKDSNPSFHKLNVDNNTPTFKAYPNPASQFLTVEIPATGQGGTLRLYDLLGKTLDFQPIQKGTSNTTIRMDISDFENGIYLLELNKDGQSEVQKIMVL